MGLVMFGPCRLDDDTGGSETVVNLISVDTRRVPCLSFHKILTVNKNRSIEGTGNGSLCQFGYIPLITLTSNDYSLTFFRF